VASKRRRSELSEAAERLSVANGREDKVGSFRNGVNRVAAFGTNIPFPRVGSFLPHTVAARQYRSSDSPTE
jgi:hypothetical protein